ncbi:MAG: DUF1566 domain-containing protein [Chromatiales bacterium]
MPPRRGGPRLSIEIADRNPGAKKVNTRIPDTHQGSCFDNSREITCPAPGQPFYGQDAHFEGAVPDYRDNGDGTVTDRVTGLTWQQAHNEQRLSFYAAKQQCEQLQPGGRYDWRLPNIKELYSLADFRGVTGRQAFINEIFEIRPPGAEVLQNDHFASTHHVDMMGQTWSGTIYVGDHWDRPNTEAAFFFNFLDGRIKQAPTRNHRGMFYRCVSGQPWGQNDFKENVDGTVTDRASGLMWQQTDDGKKRNWQEALAYCQDLPLAGFDDWRLPNVKELQSIVDYGRAAPALDTSVFSIRDKTGWFWSSTTLGENPRQATYVCFGKCTSIDGVDVHGAGAQRSDPKAGNAASFGSQGGQRDEIRVLNYVRCVR